MELFSEVINVKKPLETYLVSTVISLCFAHEVSVFSNYSQTLANDHLRIVTTCLQRHILESHFQFL